MVDKIEKIVYVPMAIDLIHVGHINIIKQAKKEGKVIVGLLTDNAVAKYKRVPLLDFEQRKIILESLKDVSKVVAQDDDDYVSILLKLKPNVVVHGDDWKEGVQKEKRDRVIKTLKKWGGKLVEPPYTEGISSTILTQRLREIGTTPNIRMKRLKRLLDVKPIIRILEAHNGITGLIVENARYVSKEGINKEFDGIWISSLTDSTSKGKPDIALVDSSSRMNTIEHILEVTTKPIIVDGDSGGLTEHFVFMVRTLERLGVSAVIIEDKIGLKKNSLFGTKGNQMQATIDEFSQKISQGKNARVTEDFMVIARIESLILKTGLEDALKRARAYIDAGADGIMIHSKEKTPDEVFAFCKEFNKFKHKVPLIAVPTFYNKTFEKQLKEMGVNIVIYANHLLRSAYPSMLKTAETILKNERAFEVEPNCMTIKEILSLIPERY